MTSRRVRVISYGGGAVIRILVGDCKEHMAAMEPDSIDSIVTDPPYGLEFMGKGWDHGVPGIEFWQLALDVLKPGGYLLAFGGTRTFHRLTVAIEDAGFEIRDCLMWLYGSGFPKSLDVSKALDKAAGAEREVVGTKLGRPGMAKDGSNQSFDSSVNTYGSGGILPSDITAPATDLARQWDGWGTALKPAWEPIIMARKPLIGSVAANVTQYGTGGLNIDGCRIEAEPELAKNWERNQSQAAKEGRNAMNGGLDTIDLRQYTPSGRWPANVLLDDEAAAMLDAQSGERGSSSRPNATTKPYSMSGQIFGERGDQLHHGGYGDTGGASRFFYTAKAGRAERNKGLEGMPEVVRNITEGHGMGPVNTSKGDGTGIRENRPTANHHPTVKPLDLMQWLVRLVTPLGGTVLDPFMGSGSTLVAADREGFNGIGIELDAEYAEIARRRVYGDAPMFAQVETT